MDCPIGVTGASRIMRHHATDAARLIFLRKERAAPERLRAQRLKETRRDHPGANRLRFDIASQQMAPGLGHTKFFERLVLLLPIEKIGGPCCFTVNAAFDDGEAWLPRHCMDGGS